MNRLFTAGFVATVVMTAFMEILPYVGFPHVDLAQIIGATIFGYAQVGTGPWWAGMAIHLFIGTFIFPFVLFVAARLFRDIPPVLAGWLLGLALFLGGEGVAIPLTGGGFFSSEAAQPGMTVLEDFLSHSLYGLLLGWMSAPAIQAARTEAGSRRARDQRS